MASRIGKSSLVCCSGCGRDTKRMDGLCSVCCGQGKSAINDQRGRRARSTQVIGGTAYDNEDAYDDDQAASDDD